jgi:hypothetical protein
MPGTVKPNPASGQDQKLRKEAQLERKLKASLKAGEQSMRKEEVELKAVKNMEQQTTNQIENS